MKKAILSLLLVLASAATVWSRDAGYRGFVDLGYAISVSELKTDYGSFDISNRLMLSTTHGYQIVPHFFIGAGLGLTYWHQADDKSVSVPIFADARLDMIPDKLFCPFIDAKIGYAVGDIRGFYFNPQIGVRIGRRVGCNIGIGYQMQKVQHVSGTADAVTIKVGVDF